jgi:hypothetical protein
MYWEVSIKRLIPLLAIIIHPIEPSIVFNPDESEENSLALKQA